MKNYKTQLSYLSSELDIGETTRTAQCPFCFKGDGDFSVTRTDAGLLFRCFRVKCDSKGFIPSNLGEWNNREFLPRSAVVLKAEGYPFESHIIPLSDEQIFFLKNSFDINKKEIRYNKIKWCSRTQRIIYPVLSPPGETIGYVARHYDKLSNTNYDGVKARTYWINRNKNYYNVSFPYINYNCCDKDGNKLFVLVEDIPSSIRVARYVPSIALLSNSIPTNAMQLLAGQNVVIALDNDATSHAIKIKQKYSLFFKSCQVIPLDLDPKNMSDNKLLTNIVEEIEINMNFN